MPASRAPSLHDSLRGAVSADAEPGAARWRPGRGLPRGGRRDGAHRRDDLRADAARRASAGEGAALGERRTEPLLPRIAPLGAFEPDEAATFFASGPDEAPHPALPAAVGALTRRHVLARLTRAWGQALRGAIREVDADGRLIVDPSEPALVAATPAQAYALAGDLAALIDDMIIEGAPWRSSRR